MSTFRITKPDSFKNYSFGKRLIDIVTALSLPTPFIHGSEMTKFDKKGVWVIHITQPGCETEPKTEKNKFKTFHTNKKMGAHLKRPSKDGPTCMGLKRQMKLASYSTPTSPNMAT
jgi:hypothetical protein